MAKWDVEAAHPFTCSQGEAVDKVVILLNEFQRENASLVKSITWNAGKTEAKATGRGFDAVFTVSGDKVEAGIKLGLALKMLKGKVQTGLQKKLDKAFA